MVVDKQLRKRVVARAAQRCEYCRIHQSLQGATFHVEHVCPISKQGSDDLGNLALACPSCNLHKSDRTQAEDHRTKQIVDLYNPREHRWIDHFRWDEYALVGRTSIGRATITALDLNSIRRLQIRQAEQRLALFPPDAP